MLIRHAAKNLESFNIIVNYVSWFYHNRNSDVIMSAMASQITGASIMCLTVCSGADQRKHQSSAPLAFVRGIHRCPVTKGQWHGKCFQSMASSCVMLLMFSENLRTNISNPIVSDLLIFGVCKFNPYGILLRQNVQSHKHFYLYLITLFA